jgi:hypothetical protein
MNITALQFGLYRDGDNNLDTVQSPVIEQAFATSARDGHIAFSIEDTTARRDFVADGGARTESYDVRHGAVDGAVHLDDPHDPSSRENLARFVDRTLDAAERDGARQTWVDLVDHGGGDGGGLESDTHKSIMTSTDMAGAIADGIALHAKEHPEDAGRTIDGVVANQCLMSTLGFADALSQDGVKYLAASPETMLAPGVPTSVAEDIAANESDPAAMAQALVKDTMHTHYGIPGMPGMGSYTPAAAMDVLDLDPQKIAAMRGAVKQLDHALATAARGGDAAQDAILDDARSVDGMVRFDHGNLPWHADRPAIALYDAFAADTRLSNDVRAAAATAAKAVGEIVLAHKESSDFGPFGGESYRDAAGPTVHFATAPGELNPWAPKVSETHTAFYKEVGAAKLDHALLA